MKTQQQFLGAWRLVSFEFRRADGELIQPLGSEPTGLLLYDTSGRFSMQISRHDRPVFTHHYFEDLAPDELKLAVSGYFAYFGKYQIDEDAGVVTHEVEGSLFPNWTGSDQERHFEFQGKRLILTKHHHADDSDPRGGRQVWERLD
jgi:hypothetical protein